MAARTTISPVKPSELEALIPTAQDSLCAVLIKWMKFAMLYYRWHRYAFPNGSMSDAFKAEVCFSAQFCLNQQPENPDSPYYQERN